MEAYLRIWVAQYLTEQTMIFNGYRHALCVSLEFYFEKMGSFLDFKKYNKPINVSTARDIHKIKLAATTVWIKNQGILAMVLQLPIWNPLSMDALSHDCAKCKRKAGLWTIHSSYSISAQLQLLYQVIFGPVFHSLNHSSLDYYNLLNCSCPKSLLQLPFGLPESHWPPVCSQAQFIYFNLYFIFQHLRTTCSSEVYQ